MWDFHDRWLSECKSKNLMVSAMARVWSICIIFNGQIRALEDVNLTIYVLFVFNTNWFFLNHLEIWCRMEFNFWFRSNNLKMWQENSYHQQTVRCEIFVNYFWKIINVYIKQPESKNTTLQNTTLSNFPARRVTVCFYKFQVDSLLPNIWHDLNHSRIKLLTP
jgi:hypothetical protein